MLGRGPPLGQHFLHDQGVLARIASCLPIEPGSLVVEIGPGQGALTEHLLDRGAQVAAVEVDRELASALQTRFANAPLEVIEADLLDVDLAELIRNRSEQPALVAGNLPYYITSPILRNVFAASERVEQAVFLMQKEVAERVVAVKNSRDYGFLSVLSRLYAEPEMLFTVAPGCFRPPPQVTSAVVRLAMRRGRPGRAGLGGVSQGVLCASSKDVAEQLSRAVRALPRRGSAGGWPPAPRS